MSLSIACMPAEKSSRTCNARFAAADINMCYLIPEREKFGAPKSSVADRTENAHLAKKCKWLH